MKDSFGKQYEYFQEQIPNGPEALHKELELTIFVDSSHGEDVTTGRSTTGMIIFLGSTPIAWSSKRQTCIQTSTFGAEFVSLKTAVEHAEMIRYYLRCMGVQVTKAATVLCDNKGMVINSTVPESTMNKKTIALAYHYVREHQANNVVNICFIPSWENYADAFTKALCSGEFNDFFYEIMAN